jgi:hypothetical protein
MKIQCPCGAKYAIDVTPGMPPVKFVCQACGQDYSAFVNELIRRELGESATASAPQAVPPPPQPAAAAPTAPPPPPPSAPEGSRLRISRPQAAETPAAHEEAPVSKYCQRHRTELTTGNCQVCQKPICPKCEETFGPFCSPFCRNKVEGPSMGPAVHIGGKFAAQRAYWRKVGTIATCVGAVLACVFGFWFWYAWFGSQPSVCFKIRWDNISHSGTSWIVDGDQLLFLHGGTLARYDLKTKQKVWSLDLVTAQDVKDAMDAEDKENTRIQHETGENPDVMIPRMQEKFTRIALESEYSIHGSGKTIWLAKDKPLTDEELATSHDLRRQTLFTHYDWNTGNVLQQVILTNDFRAFFDRNNEMVAIEAETNGSQIVTHISMNDGAMHSDVFFAPAPVHGHGIEIPANGEYANSGQGGLPLNPRQAGRPMDPSKVAEQAQNMSVPGRIALPALLANSEHNQQIIKEAQSDDNQDQRRQRRPRRQAQAQASSSQDSGSQGSDSDDDNGDPTNPKHFTLVPDGDNFIAMGEKMTKANLVERDAMRAAPAHSALDNPNLSLANEGQMVNEQLNEIQRNNGGGTVMEDQSTYQVVLRRTSSTQPDWNGQVIGTPQFYPLTNVNVLISGKTLMVFDKTNKKLWQANLSYEADAGGSRYGAGPCVEKNGTLYVFDKAILTAFDMNSGNVRWRIPSVGVVGMFFDDKGMIYVNTTTGNPDDIKYSMQIDVGKSTQAVVMKIDPANGTILWRSSFGGYISYLSGKFMYSDRAYDPGDEEDQADSATSALFGTAYLKIYRIDMDNGHVMWEHDEDRAPVDIEFDQNKVSIVLKKEVEVLKFISL